MIEIDLAERDLREQISTGRLMPIDTARRELTARIAVLLAQIDARLAELADLIAGAESDALAVALAKGQFDRLGERP